MDEARKKVEDFRKNAGPETLTKIRWNITVEKGLDYHGQRRAEKIAFDNAIAQEIGVVLTDHETWPDEQGKILAIEWAAGLPDA